MKTKLLIIISTLSAVCAAAPILGTGTPSNSYHSPAVLTPSPAFGTLFNFDSLTAYTTYSSYTAAPGVTISSPDGLEVYPFSTQSGPNELYDTSAGGSANISIRTSASYEVGIGIADSDRTAAGTPVTIDLQALNSSGVGFGNIFAVTIPVDGSNPGNGYFTLSDTASDIFGLQILQPIGNASLYSGLAIDDLQVASSPEPATFALLGLGVLLAAAVNLRKRA